LVQRLRWCDGHRRELATMVGRIHERLRLRDWSDVGADFEAACRRGVQ
jgi:hypothetical protein